MADQLQADETPVEGVRRIILERADYIQEQMLNPVEGREKAVHNARKSCKRIRAALRLLRPAIGHAAYRQENIYYRDASRLVAPIRDSGVLLEVVDKLAEAEVLPASFLAEARERLAARHTIVCQQLLAETDVMEQMAARMVNGRSRLLALPLSDTSFAPLAAGMGRIYRLGRRDAAQAYTSGRPELFHEWRKQVKYLWHHLETVQPIRPEELDQLIPEFNRLSDFLGDAHDLLQLRHALEREATTFTAGASFAGFMAVLDKRRHDLEQAACPLFQQLYPEKPAAFTTRFAAYGAAWEGERGV